MLLSLDIKNVALITHLKLEFNKGLNILSGETGAGKSIILDSLMFALGSKADKSLIRNGENIMSVEAVFEIAQNSFIQNYLKELGFDDDILILYRTINTEGRSTINLNGRTITLSMLRTITPNIIDIYSQAEHISLLKPSTHIDFLDGYGNNQTQNIINEILSNYKEYKTILEEIAKSGGDKEERERLIELYEYQIEEIENAGLSEEEEQELLNLSRKLSNTEKITEEINNALILFSGDTGILSYLNSIKSILNNCSKFDKDIEPIFERFDSANIEIDDIHTTISDYIYNLEYDKTEAERVENRLEQIKKLKRKYGNTIQIIFEYKNQIKNELTKLVENSKNAQKLLSQKIESQNKLYKLSKELSYIRKEVAKKFENEVKQNLNDLSMKGCNFKVKFNDFPKEEEFENQITKKGMDKLEFFISTNKGEPLKPLAKIISGGEMSRFMLAIKSILSETDNIDTLIFDEIDTGISGVTATAVAKKFACISQKHQIIAITHLPQIAAMADVNFLIEKKENNNTVQTFITKLSKDNIITEIARLIGSAEVSTHGKLHAEEMLKWSNDYKNNIK